MADVVKTEQGLKDYLRNVLVFMKASSDAYDNWVAGEAKRLAVCVKILVHDTAGAPSVLSRLGIKDMPFYDGSPDYNPAIGLPFTGLAVVTIGGKSHKYKPRIGANLRDRKYLPFDAWWSKPVIVDEQRGINLTREYLVLGVAVSEAGEPDKNLTGLYRMVTEDAPSGWAPKDRRIHPDLMEIALPSVRQIAYEVVESLRERYPEYL